MTGLLNEYQLLYSSCSVCVEHPSNFSRQLLLISCNSIKPRKSIYHRLFFGHFEKNSSRKNSSLRKTQAQFLRKTQWTGGFLKCFRRKLNLPEDFFHLVLENTYLIGSSFNCSNQTLFHKKLNKLAKITEK